MDTKDFNAMVQSWPVREKVVGQMADGSPIVVQVHSMFGDDK